MCGTRHGPASCDGKYGVCPQNHLMNFCSNTGNCTCGTQELFRLVFTDKFWVFCSDEGREADHGFPWAVRVAVGLTQSRGTQNCHRLQAGLKFSGKAPVPVPRPSCGPMATPEEQENPGGCHHSGFQPFPKGHAGPMAALSPRFSWGDNRAVVALVVLNSCWGRRRILGLAWFPQEKLWRGGGGVVHTTTWQPC